MSDGIDQAANAFQAAMNEGNPAPRQENDAPKEQEGLEFGDVFGNFNQHADNSEAQAGGDDLPSPVKPKKAEPKLGAEFGDETDSDLTAEELAVLQEGQDPDEGDGDEGDEGQDPDEGDEGDDGQKYLVTVDGTEMEVTLEEALGGYIRTETFHQRMEEVNKGKQFLAGEAAKLTSVRDAMVAQLQEIEALSQAIIPAEPNWDDLFAKDPVAARAMQKQYQELNAKIGETRAMREKVAAEKAKEEMEQTRQYAADELQKFLKMNPRIRTDKEFEYELNSMHRTAKAAGFADAEILQVYDSRMLRILQKASKYDRMMANKPKPANPGKGKPGKSTKANTKQAQERAQRQSQRLRQTGSVTDAAVVFQNLLDRG